MRLLFLVALACSACLPALGQSRGGDTRANGKVERELLRLTEAISLASERKDKAALGRLISDDFVLTLADGRTFTKSQMIERWAAADPEVTEQSHTISAPRAYVYGETAVVVAMITDRWRDGGGEHTYRERIFDVWQKRRGGWRLVASKPTKVTEQ